MNRHIHAIILTIVVMTVAGTIYYSYKDEPVTVHDITIVDSTVRQGTKVTIRYRVTERRRCSSKLIASISDGTEVVRKYESDLYEPNPPQAIDVVVKDIGLPEYTAPGRAIIHLSAVYTCHRIHQLISPLEVDLGTYTFNVSDKEGTKIDPLITSLRAEIYSLNVKVIQLSLQLQALKDATFSRPEHKRGDAPQVTSRHREFKLRATPTPVPAPRHTDVKVPKQEEKQQEGPSLITPVKNFFKEQLGFIQFNYSE